jgi:dephospho-CoA kinase
MLKVGLTGSIAVGKSFVLGIFRELGANVLDADQTARDVVGPGTAGLAAVAEVFGPGVIAEDGSLDRAALAEIVFADANRRQKLNSIVHPLVIREQDAWLSKCEKRDPAGIAIIDAALMIESGTYKRFDKLIVVWCEPAIQLQRLMLRDGLDEPTALRRIGSQLAQEEKRRYATFLIDTSNGKDETRRQTIKVYEQLRAPSL